MKIKYQIQIMITMIIMVIIVIMIMSIRILITIMITMIIMVIILIMIMSIRILITIMITMIIMVLILIMIMSIRILITIMIIMITIMETKWWAISKHVNVFFFTEKSKICTFWTNQYFPSFSTLISPKTNFRSKYARTCIFSKIGRNLQKFEILSKIFLSLAFCSFVI